MASVFPKLLVTSRVTGAKRISPYVTSRFVGKQVDTPQRRRLSLWQPLLSNGSANTSGGGQQGGKKHWWSMSFESKVISSILFGVISYFLTSYFDKQHARREQQLDLITRQIRDLYGPLYGNRLVQETSYKGVVGELKNLKSYLKKAETERNAQMIQKWRHFVYNVLYPLDKEAQELLCKNAHLVATDEFPEEFKLFLTHFARLQFVMEDWKKDGKLESTKDFTDEDYLESTNASGEAGLSRMLIHVEEKCRDLRITQRRLIVELSAEDGHHQHIAGTLKKISK